MLLKGSTLTDLMVKDLGIYEYLVIYQGILVWMALMIFEENKVIQLWMALMALMIFDIF